MKLSDAIRLREKFGSLQMSNTAIHEPTIKLAEGYLELEQQFLQEKVEKHTLLVAMEIQNDFFSNERQFMWIIQGLWVVGFLVSFGFNIHLWGHQ